MTDEVGKHSKGAMRAALKMQSMTFATFEHPEKVVAECISRETSDIELAEALRSLLEIIRRGCVASAKDVETYKRAEKLLSEVVG